MSVNTKVKVKKMRLADVEGADYNPREITRRALLGLQESIRSIGMIDMPVVNQHGGVRRLVSGHQRFRALKEDGYEFVDCIVVDFDPLVEKAANVTLNNPKIQGVFDIARAVPTIDAVVADVPEAERMGLGALQADLHAQAERIAEFAGIRNKKEQQKEDAISCQVVVSEPNTVYRLGSHRLLCGDSLVGGNLERLLDSQSIAVTITDPPYNVDYHDHNGAVIENDRMDDESWELFVTLFCTRILAVTSGACFVFMSIKEMHTLDRVWRDCGGLVYRRLYWLKNRLTMNWSDYRHQYEGFLCGGRIESFDPTSLPCRANVFEYPNSSVNALHPTQKPLPLIRVLLEDSTVEGDGVFDPFAGSGTTLIAAEESGRVCYTAETSRRYCDVVRKRWVEKIQGHVGDWENMTPAVEDK